MSLQERAGDFIRIEHMEDTNEVKMVFELINDEPPDPFCRKFISDHLVQLKNYECASRFGFEMDSWTKGNGRSADITGFVRFNKAFNHIELKYSYLKNARFATANGCYGIRGLTLSWDSAIWGLLREIESIPYSNPFTFPSCEGICEIIKNMQFRDETTAAAKSLCRATVAIQYALSILYGYDRCGSLPRYLRCLIDDLLELYERMRNMSLMPNLKIEGKDLSLIQQVLPERICQQLGISMTCEACLLDDYYDCVESNIEMMFDSLCNCNECALRRSDRFCRISAARIGEYRKKKSHRGLYFEENDVRVQSYPELGVIRLPKVRHIDEVHQTRLCKRLARDLMFDLQFGPCSALSRIQGVPLPFIAVDGMDIDLAYALYLASNVYFLCFLIKCVRDVIRNEEIAYTELAVALVKDAASILREDVEQRVRAGAEFPKDIPCDPRISDISPEARDLALAQCLEELSFSGLETTEQYGTIGGFCRDAAKFMDLSEAYHVPKALREHRAREEVILHTFYIKKMYDERPLPHFYGEKLVPYHVFVGGYRRRDGALIRMKGITLSDMEIARGHWTVSDVVTSRMRVYENFDNIDMIKDVCIRKETFMMDLDKMYVPKIDVDRDRSEDELSTDSETVNEDTDDASSVQSLETTLDESEFVVETIYNHRV